MAYNLPGLAEKGDDVGQTSLRAVLGATGSLSSPHLSNEMQEQGFGEGSTPTLYHFRLLPRRSNRPHGATAFTISLFE